MSASAYKPPLLVIVGETGSGKTALAMELAERFDGEIISADSWSVYKHFDIGTAKPSQAERIRIQHHMVDIVEPEDGFSAAIFKRQASQQIVTIAARGRLPVMVGGTGLYIDSVLYDYKFLPPPTADRRRALNSMTLQQLLQEAEAKELDTSGIDIRNKRRIIRLIENNGRLPGRADLRPNTVVLGLSFKAEQLGVRVTARVDGMLAAGLEEEVRTLAKRYNWDTEPMKGVGYREFKPYISGTQTLDEVRLAIIRDTIALAKKQRIWFKRNKSIHWLTTDDKLAEAVDYATTLLNK